jgi:hypothetical protein
LRYKFASEPQLQSFAHNSSLINNSPNWYQNDCNRVNFPQNQTPLNLELHRVINCRFSEIGEVKFRFIQNRGGKTVFKPIINKDICPPNIIGIY